MRHVSTSGFTLIEAVVATAVMAAVVATVAHVVVMSAGQSVAARGDMRAVVLAQSKLEELRASPGVPVSGTDSAGDVVRRWVVAEIDAGEPGLLSIRVCIDASSACVAGLRGIQP